MSSRYEEIGELVVKAQAGSQAAAEMLLLNFKPLILTTISQYVYDKSLLEDAFQDACVVFMESLKAFKGPDPNYFPAYVKKQLFYAFVQKAKGRRGLSVQAELSLDAATGDGGALGEALPDRPPEETGAERFDREQRLALDCFLLKSRIGRLPENQRALIRAHYYDGLSYRAIARKRHQNESSVAAGLKKAMVFLRKAFGVE